MFCPRCGRQSALEANFCSACGTAALPQPHPYSQNYTQTRIVRPRAPRMLAGVCSGIAIHYGWDVALVRILTAVAALTLGFPILIYLVAWILLPDAPYALPPVRNYTPAPPQPPPYTPQTY